MGCNSILAVDRLCSGFLLGGTADVDDGILCMLTMMGPTNAVIVNSTPCTNS